MSILNMPNIASYANLLNMWTPQILSNRFNSLSCIKVLQRNRTNRRYMYMYAYAYLHISVYLDRERKMVLKTWFTQFWKRISQKFIKLACRLGIQFRVYVAVLSTLFFFRKSVFPSKACNGRVVTHSYYKGSSALHKSTDIIANHT
jgi:hypothetical protein